MKILLINVCMRPENPRYILPVGLGYIAMALKNANQDFDLLDLDVIRPDDSKLEQILSEKTYDMYLMGCIVTGYKTIKKLAAMIRQANPKGKIVVGNSVASSIPQLLLEKTEVDIACFSEADTTILEIIEAYKTKSSLSTVQGIAYLEDGKNYARTPHREAIRNIDNLPFIDWDLFDVKYYNERSANLVNDPCDIPMDERVCMAIPSARGCPFRCSFCYFVFRDDKYRCRSARSIVDEIISLKTKYGMNYVNYWDELTFPTLKHCEAVCDAIIEADLGIQWNATVRGDLLRREEHIRVAEKLRLAGCVGLTYSLEHVNKDILQMMNKKLRIDIYLTQKKILDEVGIFSWTNLVLGYPIETPETIREAIDFCYENNMYPSTGYLLPLPDTPMYQYALDNNYIADEEEYLLTIGDRQDLYLNMTEMDDDTMMGETEKGLARINQKLGLGLGEDSLIKTTNKKGYDQFNQIT